MATEVALAAGIGNELGPKEIDMVKKMDAEHLHLFYYLPRIPAEYTIIPSQNDLIMKWRKHAVDILDRVGSELKIPKENRHFIDEVIGPDKLFEDAKNLYHINVILTHDKAELKQTFLSKAYDQLAAFFKGIDVAEVPVADVAAYLEKKGIQQPSSLAGKERAKKPPSVESQPEPHSSPVSQPWSAKGKQAANDKKNEPSPDQNKVEPSIKKSK